MRAEKLRIGPGIMGKMHPTMPAMAKINPITMRATVKGTTRMKIIRAGKFPASDVP